MTISVLFIEGSRKSACNNNAWSVVRNDRELLAIIPAATLQRAGHDQDALRAAFQTAHNDNPGAPAPQLAAQAQKLLRLKL